MIPVRSGRDGRIPRDLAVRTRREAVRGIRSGNEQRTTYAKQRGRGFPCSTSFSVTELDPAAKVIR